MAKVYVSSMIADLTEERRAVLDWLRLARHQAVDSYLPDSDTVRDSCLDDVAACDLYVLILGHRYGFQPAEDNPEGLSITHLEFRRAGECGIPRVALLRTSIPDASLSDLEDPARAPLVLAFRAEVARSVRPAQFRDLQGLTQGLSTGIQSELDKLGKRPADQMAARRVLRLAPRPVFLAGREELLADLDARLAEDGAGPRVVALCGLGGAGKTSVALEYAHRHLAGAGLAWQFPADDPQVAAGFLAARTGDTDRKAALQLAGELGGLPLALEQAAAYVQASGNSLAWYLALFRKRRPEMLARGKPTGYPQTVATTWRLAFEDVQQAAPGAAGLLRLLAFYAPEAIPLWMLLQPSPGLAGQLAPEVAPVLAPLLDDELAAGDAIAALRRYSLISLPADGSVSVHRLVQAVTVDQMPAELAEAWQRAAAALIEAVIPAATALPETWLVCAELLPHAQAALADDSDGMARIADYIGSSVSYDPARDLHQKVAEAWARILGPEHPQTLDARGGFAYWTREAGNAAGSQEEHAALLPVLERVLGPEHLDTLIIRADIAHWTGEAGDPAAARDQYADLVPVYERVLGPEHPDTLAARASLARWTGQAGDAAAARDQYAALLPLLDRALGPEHPDTLTTRGNLARWTGEAGDPAGAPRPVH